MNVKFEKLDDVNGVLTVSIEENDYAPEIKKQLKEISKKRPEPGFRPGHVPVGLIQKKYGAAVKYEVINRTVGDAVFNYIKENDLQVLGNPVPSKDNNIEEDAKDFEFTFKLGLAPEINTHLDKDLHVPYYTIKVSDEMIDKQSDALRQRLGSQEPAETVEDENAVIKGTITELNADGTVKEDGIKVEDGILSPRHFVDEDQKKLFVGHKVGDHIVFNPSVAAGENEVELASMLHIDRDAVKDHKGDFGFDITEIIVARPAELNQEYFDNAFGKDKVHNEEEYRKAIKDLIASQLSNDSNYRFTIDAKEALEKAVGDVVLPDEVMKEFLIERNEDLNEENIEEEYKGIRPQLVWEIIREAVAKQLDVKVSKEDLLDAARMIARSQFAQYGMYSVPEETLEKYAAQILEDKKAAEQIANQTLDMKLYNGIRATVTTDEKEVSVDEFNALFAPAEKAE